MQKMHLILTPDVFALRLDAAIFAHDIAKIIRKPAKTANSALQKSLPSAFLKRGCANDAAPDS